LTTKAHANIDQIIFYFSTMNYSPFKTHRTLWISLAILLAATFSLAILFGLPKSQEEINWLDAIGEGGICIMVLVWLTATLFARPKGSVTNWMFCGLSSLLVSTLLDFFDEFVRFAPDEAWFSNVEAFPAVVGMIVMTVAAKGWYKEQETLNQTLMKKERFYRSHSHCDFITGLYNAKYMKEQIEREMLRAHHGSPDFCIGLFDIKGFTDLTRAQGLVKANQLLRDIGELISLNLRDADLVCRYAGDRFIVLFAECKLAEAQQTARHIADIVAKHTQYTTTGEFTAYSEVTWSVISPMPQENVDTMLSRLHQKVQQQKRVA